MNRPGALNHIIKTEMVYFSPCKLERNYTAQNSKLHIQNQPRALRTGGTKTHTRYEKTRLQYAQL